MDSKQQNQPIPELPDSSTEENAPLTYYLGGAMWSIKQLLEKELGVHGIAVRILHLLDMQDGLTQNHLSGYMRVDPSMITRLVKDMEKKHHWVRRERDPEDNRLVRVYLTEKGKEQAKLLPRRTQEIENIITKSLTKAEVAELKRILSVLDANARAELEETKESN
jgi:DNA-binding MarR family transcriptional regulator